MVYIPNLQPCHPAQVDTLKSMDKPDPKDEKIVKYAQTLKLSHEAAMRQLWGLDKGTEGADSPNEAAHV